MNAAEITDKLGLHSLRQRAWVSRRWLSRTLKACLLIVLDSTSNQLVLRPVMDFTRAWSG